MKKKAPNPKPFIEELRAIADRPTPPMPKHKTQSEVMYAAIKGYTPPSFFSPAELAAMRLKCPRDWTVNPHSGMCEPPALGYGIDIRR